MIARVSVLGSAILIVLLGACSTQGPAPEAARRDVMVKALTPLGDGVSGVAVRIANQVVITDASGHAVFPGVRSRAALQIDADCPRGYSGEPLRRVVPQGLASSSDQWSFEIRCEPEFIEVSLAVTVSDCEPAIVSVDGIDLGSTKDGIFHAVQRHDVAGTLGIRVRGKSHHCGLDVPPQTIAFDRRTPGIWAEFDGACPKKRAGPLARPTLRSVRPYRL